MRQNLLEKYSRQISIAEGYVAATFEGKKVSDNTKLTTAVLLDNTNRWITESINTVSTARTDLGDWKKFCLNLTNIAIPSLIANDLVIVHPMTSYSGSVAYLKYVSKTDKGGISKGAEFNSVFRMGDPAVDQAARTNFTSQVIVENVEEGAVALTPVVGGLKYRDADGNIATATYKVAGVYKNELTAEDEGKKVAYVSEEFQMEKTPAKDIPTIGPKMEHIALVAEPRRIAVRYDQITAFQAKTDYGFSLDKQIAEQACGELAYEIDTEIVDMLYQAAKEVSAADALEFDKTRPYGVSKFEHYNTFLETIEEAKMVIYNRTKKFHPTYMVIASDVLPVLTFVNGFKPANVSKMNGPYKVGTLGNLDVYVSPLLDAGDFFLGLNGNDMMSSAGVYAPYMAIVPTQLLGMPDGGLMQGFSTWYAKAILNKDLLVYGKVVGNSKEIVYTKEITA